MYLPGLIIFTLLSTLALGITNETIDAEVRRQKRDESCLRLKYRPIDGSCNNAQNPRWGQAGTPYFRFLPPDYADGRLTPRRSKSGDHLPLARVVSLNLVHDVDDQHPTYSHMLMQWGQIINHDVSKKRTGSESCCDDGNNPAMNNQECMSILLPNNEPVYSRKRCLGFTRTESIFVNGRREQINDVTSFVDGSPVYGVTPAVSRSLRSLAGGKLKSQQQAFGKELLPRKESDSTAVNSGDSRTNMIPSLVSMHVVLLRLHNRIAQDLSVVNPHWNDETLYQEARRIVIAVIQHITYNELLPIILGENNLEDLRLQNAGYFNGYNPNINPSVDNGFAAAAYRFGHSLIRSRFARLTNNLQEVSAPLLSTEFFNISSLNNRGEVDRIIFGLLHQSSQNSDSGFTPQIHHRLFSVDGAGSDLYSINIQRGRDHGVPGYVFWRRFCGLSRPNNFQELSGLIRPDAVNVLRTMYDHVDDIDLYAAGMAEFPLTGSLVGPTFACIIGQQFSKLRRGDRFWYENGGQTSSFTLDQLQEIRKMSLAQILCETADDMGQIQRSAMKLPGGGNPTVRCDNLPKLNLRVWADQQNNRENVILDQFERPQSQQSQQFQSQQPQRNQIRFNQIVNEQRRPQQNRPFFNQGNFITQFFDHGNGQISGFSFRQPSQGNDQNPQSVVRLPGNGPFGHFIRF